MRPPLRVGTRRAAHGEGDLDSTETPQPPSRTARTQLCPGSFRFPAQLHCPERLPAGPRAVWGCGASCSAGSLGAESELAPVGGDWSERGRLALRLPGTPGTRPRPPPHTPQPPLVPSAPLLCPAAPPPPAVTGLGRASLRHPARGSASLHSSCPLRSRLTADRPSQDERGVYVVPVRPHVGARVRLDRDPCPASSCLQGVAP